MFVCLFLPKMTKALLVVAEQLCCSVRANPATPRAQGIVAEKGEAMERLYDAVPWLRPILRNDLLTWKRTKKLREFVAARFGLLPFKWEMHYVSLGDAESARIYEEIRVLVDGGANPNVVSGNTTALLEAVGYGLAGVVRLLLDRGAIPNSDTLLLAVSWNRIEIVRMLLEAGVKPENIHLRVATNNLGVSHPLFHKTNERAVVAHLLLDAGANADGILVSTWMDARLKERIVPGF